MASSSRCNAGAVPAMVRGVLKKKGCGIAALTAASALSVNQDTITPTLTSPAIRTLTPPSIDGP